MKKRIENGSEEFQFWKDIYAFRQKYYELDSEDTLDAMLNEADELELKFRCTDFGIMAKKMLIDIIEDVDRRNRNGKTKEEVQTNRYTELA